MIWWSSSRSKNRIAKLELGGPGLERPAFAVVVLDKFFGFGGVGGFEFFGVPLDFFSGTEGDVAEERGFGERAGVVEAAGGFAAGFTGLGPFFVMADGVWNLHAEFGGTFHADQLMIAVVGDQTAFAANEKDAAFPFVGEVGREDVGRGLAAAVIPGEGERFMVAALGRELVADNEPGRC